jgi:RNA polymerase sigma factor (sigma-70 family)
MTDHQTLKLQDLLDRITQGDAFARRELVGCAYERLRLLARKILHEDFPRLSRLHETGSVLHEATLRLLRALEEIQVPSVPDFFRFAAVQIRRVLLDRARRPLPAIPGKGECDRADSTDDPSTLADWTRFHEKVAELPLELRDVVEHVWYLGLTQAATAKILNLHPKEVSRRWLEARLALADVVPGFDPDQRKRV